MTLELVLLPTEVMEEASLMQPPLVGPNRINPLVLLDNFIKREPRHTTERGQR